MEIVKAKDYELDAQKGEEIQGAFAPAVVIRENLAAEFKDVMSLVIDEDSCKKARELRLKLRPVRTGIDKTHKAQKHLFRQAGLFVDALKNAAKDPIEQMEKALLDREKHFENIETERIARLNEERSGALKALGIEWIPAGLAQMDQAEWEQCLKVQKIAMAAAVKEEEDRIAEEERTAEKQKEALAENERLKSKAKESEAAIKREADKVLALEKEKSDAEALVIKEQAEEAAMTANKEHRRKINKGMYNAIEFLGADPELAEKIARAIIKGDIPHVSINY